MACVQPFKIYLSANPVGIICFLSGDSAIVDSDWLENLLNHAQRPEVGAVGPKIINADGKIQSAGLVWA